MQIWHRNDVLQLFGKHGSHSVFSFCLKRIIVFLDAALLSLLKCECSFVNVSFFSLLTRLFVPPCRLSLPTMMEYAMVLLFGLTGYFTRKIRL